MTNKGGLAPMGCHVPSTAFYRPVKALATRIVSYWWRRCLYYTWPHQGFHVMWCNYSVDRCCRRKLEGNRVAMIARGRYNDFFWPDTISMDGFVRGKWTSRPGYPYKGWLLQFARKTKARFTNLIENKIVPPCPPPSPSWGASKHNSVFLLSFQSSETLK